jgi:2-methylcitrate dehydratase PrpD
MTAPGASVARRFARFALGPGLATVAPPVAEQAALLLLDTLGSCLAASRQDFGVAVSAAASRMGGPAESTVVGSGAKIGAANAVLANGTLAHGLDFDDTREDAIVHTGSVAVPTALAVGEAVGASGRAVLAAIIAGVEVMCRVGLAVPGRFHARHFHPTALAGSFAAAAVAGRLYGLTEDELVNAFGICGSQSAGIIEYLADGSWTKRMHPGWAAHAGVAAAVLARSGFTGPESVFEGDHGFYQAFAGGHDPARLAALLDTLGETWEIEQLTFKPYPCGSIAHPYMDCAARLRARHGVRAEDIAEIRCRTAEGPVPRLWEPLADKHRPANGYASKFSLPYLLAVILVKGRATLAEFTDEAAADPAVLSLASRVTYEIDPSIDYPRQFVGHVAARLRDGRRIEERQDRPRGGPDFLIPKADLEEKFRGNAVLAVSREQSDRVIEMAGKLWHEPSVTGLVEDLVAPDSKERS